MKLNEDEVPALDVVIATLCYLMSRYASAPSLSIAKAVSQHFRLLHDHPDCDSSILQDVGQRMSLQWDALSSPNCCKESLRQTFH